MTLGDKIRYKREQANISQTTLAREIGVNSSMVVSNWELNKSTPDTEKLIKICITLNAPISYFYPIAKKLPEFNKGETTAGQRLRYLINKKGYKIKYFAELSGIVPTTLSKFLGDKPMSDRYIVKAAELLGTSYEYIKYGTETPLSFEKTMEWKEKAEKYDQIKELCR